MSKLIRLTLGTFFVTISLYGQEITKEDIIKFKIKSITTIDGDELVKSIDYYNDSGDIIKISDKDNGEIKTRKEFIYNNDRLLIEEKTYNTDDEVHHISKYIYNENNQLVKKESYNPDKIDATWTYEYDQSGNKIKETQQSGTMGNNVTVFKYSGKQLIEEAKTNEKFGKDKKTNFKYNDNGQLTEKKSLYYYSNTTITQTYKYDETGKLIQEKQKSSNGVSSKTTYQYNDKGLLISDTWKSSLSKTPNKTRYIIEF